jgi:hypothetical protein
MLYRYIVQVIYAHTLIVFRNARTPFSRLLRQRNGSGCKSNVQEYKSVHRTLFPFKMDLPPSRHRTEVRNARVTGQSAFRVPDQKQ